MSKAASVVVMIAMALGTFACGGEPDAAIRAESTGDRAPEGANAAEAEDEPAVPEPTPAPPPAEDEPAAANAPTVPGTPLTVLMNEVRAMEPGATPTEFSGEVQALHGRVRVELRGYTTYCSPEPELLAHLDGETIRLFQPPTDIRSRCVQPYRITADVGPLPSGTYTIQTDAGAVGEVEVAAQGELAPPEGVLAVSQANGEGRATGDAGVESITRAEGGLRVSLRAAIVCTAGAPALFVAHRDGDRLVLRPEPTGPVARCATMLRPYTLLVHAGEFRPTQVVLQSYQGETVVESDVSLGGEPAPAN